MGRGTETLKGAAGGAAVGAALGSVFPVIGTGAGAGVGGLVGGTLGWFGADDDRAKSKLDQTLDEFGRPVPQNFQLPGFDARAGQIGSQIGQAQGQLGGARQAQTGLVSQLQGIAAGQGPSLATQLLRQATARNIAGQQALAASAAPGQSAMAARLAAQQAGQLGGSLASQAATARAQEQLGALGQLGQATANLRGADQNLLQQLQQMEIMNAQLQQQGAIEQERNRATLIAAQLGVPLQPTLGDRLLNMVPGLLPYVGGSGGGGAGGGGAKGAA